MAGSTIQWIQSFLNWLNNPGSREPEIRNAIRSAGFLYGREEVNEELSNYVKELQEGAGITVDPTDPQRPTVAFTGGEGTVKVSDIDATGTPSSGTYLRGDGTWQTPAGAGDMAQAVYDPTGVNADAFDRANHHGDIAASDIDGLAAVATTGDYADLSGAPALATVATTGDYDDLTNKPTLGTAAAADAADFATAADGLLAQSAVQPAEIADMLVEDDVGTTVQAYDADTAKTDVAQAWTETQRGTIVPVAPAATITLNLNDGQEFRLSAGLDQNATLQLSNADSHVGAHFSFTGYNNGTGGFTLSYGTGLLYIGGTSAPAIPTGANKEWRVDGHIVAAGKYHFTARGVGV